MPMIILVAGNKEKIPCLYELTFWWWWWWGRGLDSKLVSMSYGDQ